MISKREFLDTYSSVLRGETNKRKEYLRVVERFLEATKNLGDTKNAVDQWISSLQVGGYADGTIDWHFRVLRAAYRANTLAWPYRHGEGPTIREREVIAQGLDDPLVRRMILAARRDQQKPKRERMLSDSDVLYLALSTTYGLRRAELAEVTPADFNAERGLVYVETKKHGRQRYHMVAEEIQPILEAALPSFRPQSTVALTRCYKRCERCAGIPHTPELGWHGFRRVIVRRLVQRNIPELTTAQFLRWKRGGSNMVDTYNRVVVIGESETGITQSTGDGEDDAAIFAVHPFLPFWGEAL